MAHGTPDYYSPQDQLVSLLAKLDDIDGGVDGVITLTDLNSAQCEMLAKLTGINTNLLTGSDLLAKLDALDAKVDGKLDISKLTSDTTGVLAKLLKIDTDLLTGGDLLAKLDNLDAKVDGKLDISKLTSETTGVLAKLLQIDTDLLTGSDLINKLDALDGTMDGRLTLSELNTSAVKTNLDLNVSKLTEIIDDLAEQLAKLIDIYASTEGRRYEGYATVTTTLTQMVDVLSGYFYNANLYTHPDNTANISIYHYPGAVQTLIATLTPGSLFCITAANTDIKAQAASGTQRLKVLVTGMAS